MNSPLSYAVSPTLKLEIKRRGADVQPLFGWRIRYAAILLCTLLIGPPMHELPENRSLARLVVFRRDPWVGAAGVVARPIPSIDARGSSGTKASVPHIDNSPD